MPVVQLSDEMAKVIFGEEVQLPDPMPATPINHATSEIVGIYDFEENADRTIEISHHQGELYLTVPKM